jgi:hypothetical protein
MSKFKKYVLNEAFLTGVNIRGKYVEVYKNPTPSDLKDIQKDENNTEKSIRLGFDEDNKMYAWSGEILHQWMETAIKKIFLFKFDYSEKSDRKFLTSVENDKSDLKLLDGDLVRASMYDTFLRNKEEVDDFLYGLFSFDEDAKTEKKLQDAYTKAEKDINRGT